MRVNIKGLRRAVVAGCLFTPLSLQGALRRMGFVQADPIRAPARAQDLILRLRVRGYRAGDLERSYSKLELEEDFLYAYGFVSRTTWTLLHPRLEQGLSRLEERVLELIASHGQIHPRQLEAYLGKEREVNAWGGYSKATTRALEALHYRGLLRVAGRLKGIRLYEKAVVHAEQVLEPGERLRRLVLVMAKLLGPLPEGSLRAALVHLRHAAPSLEGRRTVVKDLLREGRLVSESVDGLRYVWAPDFSLRAGGAKEQVRFLAPFDPLVWDRRRFEHLWGWRYRFEAYTPVAKRKLGYYAMPVLWADAVVGWVNVAGGRGGLEVSAGFWDGKPREAAFAREFDAEVERLRMFLRGTAED